MSDSPRDPAIRVLMMPPDTNAHGTIFGGVILSYLDQAGAVSAIRLGCRKVVTVSMDKVEFHQPVWVGDLVSFYAEVISVGRSSMTIRVEVEAEGRHNQGALPVTSANVTFVNVDDDGRPIPVPNQD